MNAVFLYLLCHTRAQHIVWMSNVRQKYNCDIGAYFLDSSNFGEFFTSSRLLFCMATHVKVNWEFLSLSRATKHIVLYNSLRTPRIV